MEICNDIKPWPPPINWDIAVCSVRLKVRSADLMVLNTSISKFAKEKTSKLDDEISNKINDEIKDYEYDTIPYRYGQYY